MAWVKRQKAPAVTGQGTLRLGSYERAVVYSLLSDPTRLRAGPKGLRGSIQADPETAAEAFRLRDGHLVLAEGIEFKVKVVAYTDGSPTAYIELWRA